MAFQPTRENQLTEDKLKWGYWWVTHKVQVRRAFSAFLIVVDVILVGYAAFGYLDWFFGSGVRERAQIAAMSRSTIPYELFRQRNAPREILFEDPTVLSAGEKTYDMFAAVSNPNAQWWAEYEYRFSASNYEGRAKRDFILPGQTKNLHQLGVKADARPGSARLIVENLVWHRVNLHMTRPDYATWSASRLNIAVSDIQFKKPEPTDPVPVSRATFTATNDTGFGYYNVGFFVSLLSGSRTVGVSYVVISELRPGERRTVDASWFFDLPTVGKVEVRPDVNIFNDRVYIPPGQ
jgi:hypothetical protein